MGKHTKRWWRRDGSGSRAAGGGGRALLKVSWRTVLAHKVRLVLTVLAVVLGTAFIAGSSILTAGLSSTFNQMATSRYADVDLVMGSTMALTDNVPADAVDVLRARDDVARVEPSSSHATSIVVATPEGQPVRLTPGGASQGVIWIDGIAGTLDSGSAPSGAGEMLLDKDTAKKQQVSAGDKLDVVTPKGRSTKTVTGIFSPVMAGTGLVTVAFDEDTYLSEFTDGTNLYEIAITTADGADIEALHHDLTETYPGVQFETGQAIADKLTSMITDSLKFVNYFLWAFAGIALVVGTFIITNTFSMIVAQRTREFALLRALGTSRRQITRSVLGEAIIVGLIGSGLGVIAGWVLVQGLMAIAASRGAVLAPGTFMLTGQSVVVPVVLGVIVTVTAAWAPARRAGSVHPVQAMRSGDQSSSDSLRGRTLVGFALVTVGILVGLAGALTESYSTSSRAWCMAAGAVGLLLGAWFAGPTLARFFTTVIGGVIALPFGTVGKLASTNTRRTPRRNATTAFALTLGLALVTSVGALGATMKDNLTGQLDTSVTSDFVLTGPGGAGGGSTLTIPSEVPAKIAELPKVKSVTTMYKAPIFVNRVPMSDTFGSPGSPVATTSPASITDFPLLDGTDDLAAHPGVLLADTMAQRFGIGVGSEVQLSSLDGHATTAPVVGIYGQVPGIGRAIIAAPVAERIVGGNDIKVDTAFVTLASGVSEQDGRAAIEEVTDPYLVVSVKNKEEYTNSYAALIDQMLTILYLLLGLAVLVAILGIVNTLALSVTERRQEIGMLRAVGTQARQVRGMIYLESVIIAIYGALLGTAIGLFIGWGFLTAMAGAGIETIVMPWGQIGLMFVASAIVGIVAAAIPARSAAGTSPLEAIADE